MVGTEDRILNPWAQFAKKYSFLPLIGDGSTKYAFILCRYWFFSWFIKLLLVIFNYHASSGFSLYTLSMLQQQLSQLWKIMGLAWGKFMNLVGPIFTPSMNWYIPEQLSSRIPFLLYFKFLLTCYELIFALISRQNLCTRQFVNILTMWRFLSLLLRQVLHRASSFTYV